MIEDSESTASRKRRRLSIRSSDFLLIPNVLSVSRVLSIPIMIVFLSLDWNWMALGIFLVTALSDWIDGYIARQFQYESKLGQLLDPIADKLIVISTMIMLLWLGRLDLQFVEFSYSELLAPVLVIVTAGREIGITGLRAIASSEGIVLAAERGGKIKTALQFVSISLLIFGEDLSVQIGQILLLISVGAALWSGVSYVLRFIKGLPA
jgi:CDP-diacylglycerol--glycerol-3-phosphate 3-phosphatidyltransferase